MCRISSKLFLLVTGALFWVAAIVLCVIGGYMFYQYHDFEKIAESTHILIPASLLMAVGLFLFLLGIVGCVGAVKEQKCLLGFFFVILMLIFIGLITATILSIVYQSDAEKQLKKGFHHGLMSYGQDKAYTEDVDFIQETLHCCGVHNYTDYLKTPWYKNQSDPFIKYPDSCCKDDKCMFYVNGSLVTNTTVIGVYNEGCYDQIHEAIVGHFKVLLGVAAGLAVFQLVGMIASCVLLCRRRSEVPYIGLVEPEGMRV